jgi:hypothetical protein
MPVRNDRQGMHASVAESIPDRVRGDPEQPVSMIGALTGAVLPAAGAVRNCAGVISGASAPVARRAG